MSALAGGDRIDDPAALRAGGTERALGVRIKAPSTLGAFVRRFGGGHIKAPSTLGAFVRRFGGGHARGLERVSRVLLETRPVAGRRLARQDGLGRDPWGPGPRGCES